MDESKTNQEPMGTEANKGDGYQSSTPSQIDEANSVVERLRLENDRKEALLKREENMRANDILSGRATQSQKEEPKKMSNAEYVRSLERGIVPQE